MSQDTEDELPSLAEPTTSDNLSVNSQDLSAKGDKPSDDQKSTDSLTKEADSKTENEVVESSKSPDNKSEVETETVTKQIEEKDRQIQQSRRQILVSGFIKNKKGEFVGGAIVKVKDENNIPVKTVVTDASGFFRMMLLYGRNKYIVEIEHTTEKFNLFNLDLDLDSVKNLEIISI